jgi:pimeloyl-ACP methyl ester carboxylesterase
MNMFRISVQRAAVAFAVCVTCQLALAAPAMEVLGHDFTFPNALPGLPAKLSEFKGLEINHFTTSDGVVLSYWEAGAGRPLVFIPGWSANGAEFVNLLYILSKHYHVMVLDPRNQGLSQRVEYGSHIARYAVDLREFSEHLALGRADYVGWSMGASVLWSYIDLFGDRGIRKLVLVDEPVAIYARTNWSVEQRRNMGAMTTSIEEMVAAFTTGADVSTDDVDLKVIERAKAEDSPYYVNSEAFARAFVSPTPLLTGQVLFDHASQDWSDVIRHKIQVPTAIFSGVYSHNLPSQRWMASVISHASLFVYSQEEQGDHFLMFKNPIQFQRDLRVFLDQ